MPDATNASACRHHWLIDPANGPTSRGRCRECGAERDFLNWVDGPTHKPSPAELATIARTKREEAAITSLVHDFGQDGYKPLSAYRRNLRDG